MAKIKYYEFTFEDGYRTIVRGLSRRELVNLIVDHGKLVSQRAC